MEDSGTSADFKVGSLVFAKMVGFPYWPGIIVDPPDELKKTAPLKSGNHCIFFYGSKNYSWVETNKLKPYYKYKDEFSKGAKIKTLREALNEIKSAYLASQDPFDNLVSSSKSKKKSLPETSTSSPEKEDSTADSSLSERKKDSPASARKSDTSNKNGSKRKIDVEESEKEYKKPKRSSERRRSGNKSVQSDEEIKSSEIILEDESSLSSNDNFSRNVSSPEIISDRESSPLPPNDHLNSNLSSPEISGHKTLSSSVTSNLSSNYSFRSNSSFIRPTRAESPPLIMEQTSDELGEKNIPPSSLSFGFIGLGKMGSVLVKNLLISGHKVTVWNRSEEKCDEFVKAGALKASTPSDIIVESDITFCCVSDAAAAKEIVFGNNGVLQQIGVGKSYVEMSGIDSTVSQDIADAVSAAGGRYLEVRFQGTKEQAEEGSLIILASGERSVYEECASAFSTFGKEKTFLGDVGKASDMQILLQSTVATSLAGLSQVMSAATLYGSSHDLVLDVFKKTSTISPFIYDKSLLALKGEKISPLMSLKHLKNDTVMALQMAMKFDAPTLMTTIANEHLKKYNSSKNEDVDIGALFFRDRPEFD